LAVIGLLTFYSRTGCWPGSRPKTGTFLEKLIKNWVGILVKFRKLGKEGDFFHFHFFSNPKELGENS